MWWKKHSPRKSGEQKNKFFSPSLGNKIQRTTVIFLVFLSAAALSAAGKWKISTVNTSEVLIRNGSQKFELSSSNSSPKVKFVREHGDYEVVVYLADVVGTTEMYELTKAAIYSISLKKIIKTLPYSYQHVNGSKTNEEQPRWVFKKNGEIHYYSVEFPDKPMVFPARAKK